MIEAARAADVPFAWFTADEEFGQNPGLREYLEKRWRQLRDGHPEEHQLHRHRRPSNPNLPALRCNIETKRVATPRLRHRSKGIPSLRLGAHRNRPNPTTNT